MAFTLHPQLAADTILVREEDDLLLLMMNDQQYPWFIVVPKWENITEWHQLPQEMQIRLHLYCVELGSIVTTAFASTKINTGALGNMVSQLHIHVVGRSQQDAAWPKPVWGNTQPIPMEANEIASRIDTLNRHLPGH